MGGSFPHQRLACYAALFGSLVFGNVNCATAQTVSDVFVVTPKGSAAQKWQEIRGSASDLAVGANGDVAAVDLSGNVYRYNHAENSWQPIGSSFARLAIDKDGGMWGVDRNGVLRRFSGTSWNAIGAGAVDVATAPDGRIYVSTNTSSLAIYDPKTRTWQSVEGQGTRIAVDKDGMIWSVSANGQIARRLDEVWITVPGSAQDIATDANGDVVLSATDGRLLKWDAAAIDWVEIKGATNSVSLAVGDGQLWYTDNAGRIFARGISDRHRNKQGAIEVGAGGSGGSASPAETPDTSPYVFTRLPSSQTLAELSIGKDGSVYGLTSGGDIKRWSNSEQQFYTFPGTLEKIDVQDSGLPMGIGTADNLVQHDGVAWRQTYLNVELNDFSIFDEDKVLSLTSLDRVAKLSDNLRSYTLLRGGGRQIVAKKDGSFWKIDSSNRLFSCDAGGNCSRKNINALDLDIGPAGSVFVIGVNNRLWRFNASVDRFDLIRGDGDVARIALGPNDRPWFISTSGQVYYTQYFNRDETQDRALSTRTQATAQVTETESGAASSGIQIVENVSFNAVTIPTTTSAYGNVGSGLRDITSGEGDVVIASGYDDPCSKGTGRNWIYNSLTSSFSYMDYLNRADIMVGLAAPEVANYDGEVYGAKPPTTVTPNIEAFFGVWPNNCTTLELLEYVPSEFTDSTKVANNNYADAVLFTPNVAGTKSDLDISKDGRLVFINSKNELKHFYPRSAASNTVRTDKTFLRVGVGADINDLWIVDTTNNVYEYVPSTDSFVLRSILDDDKAQDVGVGFDGTVYIVNSGGTLKKWNETSGRFVKTNKTGVTRVAVDSRGRPIVGNFPNSQIVYFGR